MKSHNNGTAKTADTSIFQLTVNDGCEEEKAGLTLDEGNNVTSNDMLQVIACKDSVKVQKRRYPQQGKVI